MIKYIKKQRVELGEYFSKNNIPCLQVEKVNTTRYDYFDTRKMSNILQTEKSILYDEHHQIQCALMNGKADVAKNSDFFKKKYYRLLILII